MRRMLIVTAALFALSMAVCTLSAAGIHRVTHRMRHLRSEAILAMEAGEIQRVEETLSELANHLAENEGWMQLVCSHDDLHELKGGIIDAQASVEFGIEDDFYQAIYRFGEGLDHIASIEEISLGNLG